MLSQNSRNFSTRTPAGLPAMMAELKAPIDMPEIQSGIEACLIKRLIDASLISSERAAALQDERNAFERRTIAHRMRMCVARFGHFTRNWRRQLDAGQLDQDSLM